MSNFSIISVEGRAMASRLSVILEKETNWNHKLTTNLLKQVIISSKKVIEAES